MKQGILILLFLVSAIVGRSESEFDHYQEIFDRANALYKDGQTEEALAQYEQITKAGYESAALYFNMGNCYFKQKDLPAAILFYEKAKKINAGDSDLTFNLDLANAQTVDKIEALPTLFLADWWHSTVRSMSEKTWSIIGLTAALIFWICLALFLFSRSTTIKRLTFLAGIFLLVFTGLTMTAAWQQKQRLLTQTEGVLFAPTATVKSEPSETGTELFIIHEGTKVGLLEQEGNWQKIVLADGNVGWVKIDDLAMI